VLPEVYEVNTLSSVPSTRDPLAALPPLFTYTEAREAGVSDRRLYALRDEGAIELVGRGLYRRGDEVVDLDLLEIAHRTDHATLCLGTALARHGLSDEIPAAIDVALPRGRRLPAVAAPVRWHRFDPDTFDIGREVLAVEHLSMGIFSAERSICDAFRLRHLEGSDQAVDALKRWLRRSGSQPSTLLTMARRFGPRATTPIRDALQVLL
jgi:predicted transcriptional regulator of viral defense system